MTTDLIDIPEAANLDSLVPSGHAWWRCRYCGKGRIFLGTVREEAAEARSHQATCLLNPTK